MRSKIGKALRSQFKMALAGLPREFTATTGMLVPGGYSVFRHALANSFTCFILLAVSQKQDSFTVEIGWSPNDQFPTQLAVDFDFEARIPPVARVRLSQLRDIRSDKWWFLADQRSVFDDFYSFEETPVEEAIARIPVAMDEVLKDLRELAMPLFERAAAAVGRL